MTPHLPTCRHGHLLVPGNLIKMGTRLVCQRCNRLACRRWGARRKERDFLTALAETLARTTHGGWQP